MDDDFDPTWEPEEVRELKQAAGRLERFDPADKIQPRFAFLNARWFRSYAASVQQVWVAERVVRADENALELARYINGESE